MNGLARFAQDERGSMSIELLVVVPILVWVFLSTFVYFDVFRTEANVNRAALTIADMFSREQTAIDDDYMEGALKLLQTLSYSDAQPDLRVTVYSYDDTTNKYERTWSFVEGTGSQLTDSNLLTLQTDGRLPTIAAGDYSILVETTTDYIAPVNIGFGPFSDTNLDDVKFETFTVIRPRYSQKLCFDTTPNDTTTGILC